MIPTAEEKETSKPKLSQNSVLGAMLKNRVLSLLNTCPLLKTVPFAMTLMGVLPITCNAKLNLFSACSATQAMKITAIQLYPTQHGMFLSSPDVPIVIPGFMAAIFRRYQAREGSGDRRPR